MEARTSEPLIVEKIIKAPAAKIWQALTDNDQMGEWYFDLADFKPEVGFTFEFSGGDEENVYRHKCVVTEVIPNKKLSHTWTYPDYQGSSTVTWELFEQGDETLVRITHTGLETFPDSPSFARASFHGGWNHILGISLKEFVEKR